MMRVITVNSAAQKEVINAASDRCLNASQCNQRRGGTRSLNVLNIDNLAVGVETKSLLLDRCLDWVLGVEDFVEFLELCGVLVLFSKLLRGGGTYCAVLGLRNEEPDDSSLKSAP